MIALRTSPETGIAAARARAAAAAGTHAFVSMTDEDGPGPVLAVKDNIDVRGVATTGATSPAWPSVVADRDAPAVAALRADGYVVVGKTNMHEWGLGSTSQNPHHGDVLHPQDPSRISGGSSGGSAVALAVGACDAALGTDTGGSIRIPSALCGTVGLRPTHGRVSLEGVRLLAPSMDVVGPMARDLDTLRTMLAPLGLGSAAGPVSPSALRIGWPRGWVTGTDDAVAAVWDRLRALGEGIDLPPLDAFVEPGLVMLYAEAAYHHGEQLRQRPETLGADVRALLSYGVEIPATEYQRALDDRLRLRDEIEGALEHLDALVLPTTLVTAPRADADPQELRAVLTPLTRPFSVTGSPVVAIPAPHVPGLPIGIQVVGRRGDDARLVEVACAVGAALGAG